MKLPISPEIDVMIITKDHDGNVLDKIVKNNAVAPNWTKRFLAYLIDSVIPQGSKTNADHIIANEIRVSSSQSLAIPDHVRSLDTEPSNIPPRDSTAVNYKAASDLTHTYDSRNHSVDISATFEQGEGNFVWNTLMLISKGGNAGKLIAGLSDGRATAIKTKDSTETRTIIWRIRLGRSITKPSPHADLVEHESQATEGVSEAWLENVLKFISGAETIGSSVFQVTHIGVGNGLAEPAGDDDKATLGSSQSLEPIKFVNITWTNNTYTEMYAQFNATFTANNVMFQWNSYAIFAGNVLVARMKDDSPHISNIAGSGITEVLTSTSIPKVTINMYCNPVSALE